MPSGRCRAYQKKLFRRKSSSVCRSGRCFGGQKVKYLLLAGLVALYVTRQEKLLTSASPWEVFSRLTALRLPPEGFGVGIVLFVLILLGMALQPGSFVSSSAPWERCSPCCRVPFARLHRMGS